MWKNLESIRRQVEDGAKEFAQVAIEGVRDLNAIKAQQAGGESQSIHATDWSEAPERDVQDEDELAAVYSKNGQAVGAHTARVPSPPRPGLVDQQGASPSLSFSRALANHSEQTPAEPYVPPSVRASLSMRPLVAASSDPDAGSGSGCRYEPNENGRGGASSLDRPQVSSPRQEAACPAGTGGAASSSAPLTYSSAASTSSAGAATSGAPSRATPSSYASNGELPPSAMPSRSSIDLPTSSAPRLPPAAALPPPSSSSSGSTEVEDMRRAYAEMKRAYDDMKVLLRKSMDECVRLSDELVRLEGEGKDAKREASEAREAARLSAKQAAEAAARATAARRDADAAERVLARTKEELEAERERHAMEAGTAELEVLRSELANTVRKATAAVMAGEAAEERARAAEAARLQAEAAHIEADRLRRQAQAEAHAALSAAEAERSTRAEAEGLSESLRQDGERRARVFNNAVKAAIGKVQRELEAERDELQAQLGEVQRLLLESKTELKRALASEEEALLEVAARTADAAAVGQVADAAEQAAERARAREQEATSRANAAEAARQVAEAELAALRLERMAGLAAVERSQAEAARAVREALEARQDAEVRCSDLERDLERAWERGEAASSALAAAEKMLELAQAQGAENVQRVQTESEAALQRVRELEAEVSQLKASGGVISRLFQMPTKEDVLTGLGLELWKDDSLRWKPGADVEAPGGPAGVVRPRGKAGAAASESLKGIGSKAFGAVSLRVWLIAAYLMLLHIAVMVTFTHSTHNASASECDKPLLVRAHERILP